MMDQPRIFISHSSQDDEFCESLAVALMDAGADVFIDDFTMAAGELKDTFRREIESRDIFILVLSKAILRSTWVRFECDHARKLIARGRNLTILPVLVEDVSEREYGWNWRFLKKLQRVGNERALPTPQAIAETLELLGLKHRNVVERSVVRELAQRLFAQPCKPYPPHEEFEGRGMYALYYRGDFPAYAELAKINRRECTTPIYVSIGFSFGKKEYLDRQHTLFQTLLLDAADVQQASNLRLEDFRCRYLVLSSSLRRQAHLSIIQDYRPIWNSVLGGFELSPRDASYKRRSAWDTLHPGREWAVSQQPSERTAGEWAEVVRKRLAKTLPRINS